MSTNVFSVWLIVIKNNLKKTYNDKTKNAYKIKYH